MTQGTEIGSRVRQARRAQGLTQLELAGLVDRSETWVRGVEKGRLVLDRRSTIDRIADVLKVDVAWLLGQPYTPLSPEQDAGQAAVPALRTSVRRTSLILSGHPGIIAVAAPVLLTQLRRRVVNVTRMRQAADLPSVMEALPMLVEQINTALLDANSTEADQALLHLVEVSHVARMVLNQLGHHDLAWSAVENAANAAARLGEDRIKASSAWDRCGVLLHTGSLAETIVVAEAALGRLEPNLANPAPEDLSLWGALQLRCAIAASRQHDAVAARQYLREAELTAERLGGDRNDFQTVFGHTNVGIHAVEIAVELGDPVAALKRARPVDVSRLASRERAVHHHIDIARAFGQTKQDENAVQVLKAAATASPHYVYNHPMARALVTQMQQRSKPSAVEAGLAPLARAMNLS